MLAPTLITLILATIELLVCLACSILLWRRRHERPDLSRLMLCIGAAHCVVTSALKYVLLFALPEHNLYHECLAPETSQWGMLSVLLILAYAVAVVRPEWFQQRQSAPGAAIRVSWSGVLLYLAPGLLLMVAHHLVPFWHRLHTFAELCQQAGQPDVLFRLIQLPLIVLYCLAMLIWMVNIRQTGLDSLWVRRYILSTLGLLLLVSTFSHFHILPLHYLHQLCVALFYAYWTYYELYDRTYMAPANEETATAESALETSLASRFATFDARVDRELLFTRTDLSRDDFARLMGVDRTTFSRLIAEHSGCQNLAEYNNRKRLAYADKLMREQPHYSIEAIMQECGFRSKATFNRVFKDYYGMTPSEYRQQRVKK